MGKIFTVSAYDGQLMVSEFSRGGIIAIAVIVLLVVLAFYLFRSIGLYTLAKNNGVDKAYIAWIPCVWIYTACMLVKEFSFFSTPYKKLALWFAIIFSVAQVLTLTSAFLSYLPLVGYFLQGGNIYIGEYAPLVNTHVEEFKFASNLFVEHIVYPYGSLRAVATILYVSSSASALFDLASAIMQINLFLAIFKKFWPAHYIVAGIVSFFGLFPFFIFAIRKKMGVRIVRYTPNYNGYTQNNYYGGGYGAPQRPASRPVDDPFAEFSDKDDEPFSDIFNNKKKGDN